MSRCSHHPQVLLVYHSDGGRGPPLSETLLFCSVGALKSPPQWSPCRCQLTAGLYAAGRRWWLTRDNREENISSAYMIRFCLSLFQDHLELLVNTNNCVYLQLIGQMDVLTALTAFIVLKVIAGVAVGISCSQSPQPGEVCYHAVGSTIHHSCTITS